VERVEIDGSYGEGGGQILRTAAAFSVISGRPIRVTKIRSGREVPGLRQQHLSALEILRQVSGGSLEGARVGSTEIAFAPGTVKGGKLSFDLRTAASITLVLQAVIPAAALSGIPLSLALVGGTDVPWSPTFDYFATVVKAAYARIGIRFSSVASRRGYYPRGGGRVSVEIEPCGAVVPLSMLSPPTTRSAFLVSRCGHLPRHVAERQLASAVTTLRAKGIEVAESSIVQEDSDSPGSSILAYSITPEVIAGGDSIGARGKPAEEVGREAADHFAAACESGACIDSNLADMVAPLVSLSKETSRFRVPSVTLHLETSLYVARLFTGCEWRAEKDGTSSVVSISH
jgi:RNA 3'-phosphate cyclase